MCRHTLLAILTCEECRMNFEDPEHLKSFDTPCEACGAKWYRDSNGIATMDHIQPCAYLESLEYGGTKEIVG